MYHMDSCLFKGLQSEMLCKMTAKNNITFRSQYILVTFFKNKNNKNKKNIINQRKYKSKKIIKK